MEKNLKNKIYMMYLKITNFFKYLEILAYKEN